MFQLLQKDSGITASAWEQEVNRPNSTWWPRVPSAKEKLSFTGKQERLSLKWTEWAYWDIFQAVILSCKARGQNGSVVMVLPHVSPLLYGVYPIPNLPGTAPAGFQFECHTISRYLHVLASGSNTSMVFKYVVPSKPPTAISCPFTTARPTCKTAIRQQLLSWDVLKEGLKCKYYESI